MRLSVDLLRRVDLDVSPPQAVADDKEALKEWLWEHSKREILANMTLELTNDYGEAKQQQEEEDAARASKLERHRNEQQRKLSLLDKISQVQRQFFQREGPKVVFGCLLEGLLELMDSEYGFIGETKYEPDGTMYLQTHAITNIAWNAATRAFYEENNDSGLKFTNLKSLFGTVVTTKQVVIANTPKNDPRACGVPPGHPPLNHFLGIPFFKKGGELVGMVGIANKPGGYFDRDVDFLEPFTVTCSNLIQAYWHIQQNRHLINTLETKVAERTLELKLANENLEDVNRKLVRASAAQLENFASMSHEIRTPLNCILGLSSLMQDSELNSMQEESMRMIVSSGDLLLTVVNDVLDFSKLESGNVDIEMLRSNLKETLDAVVH
jgi:GAF domain-containing protein